MSRDAKYYRSLLTKRWVASVRFPMAANAVYAAKFGTCDADHFADKEWLFIADKLKKKYGTFLKPDQVLSEMESP